MTTKKKRYKSSFLKWTIRYSRWDSTNSKHSRDDKRLGIEQWFDFESYGHKPDNPSPFFIKILNGKRWHTSWENGIKDAWFNDTDMWFGFMVYSTDMPRWVFEKIFKWHPDSKEISEFVYNYDE